MNDRDQVSNSRYARAWRLLRASALSRAACVVLAVVTCGERAHAMVVPPASLGEMVAASPVIVHALVLDVRSYELAGRRTIETLVTLQVIDALKGDPGTTAYFKVPGGQVGRYRRVMVGAPTFARGEEVVLFLAGRAPAVPVPFGLTQGVYRVVRGPDGSVAVTPLVNATAGRLVRGDRSRRPLDLYAFTARVRALAGPTP